MSNATVSIETSPLIRRGASPWLAAPLVALGALALALAAATGAGLLRSPPLPAPVLAAAPAPPPLPAAAPVGPWAASGLLDPAFSAGYVPAPLWRSALLGPRFDAPTAAVPQAVIKAEIAAAAPAAPAPTPLRQAEVPPAPVATPPAGAASVEGLSVPMPMPRPPERRIAAAPQPIRAFVRRLAHTARAILPAPTHADDRSFFEKLFGLPPSPGPLLAYATPEDGIRSLARRLTDAPTASYDRWTAVYDIAAHTVYMPNGARLEAHSGLGTLLDDPNHVHEQNRGAIPPHAYDLQLREQLFHGVQALRLNPVGGGGVFGRTGFLAHTYMLGPRGDSNGCVSFRDYDVFLQAYHNGEVKRLVVVPRLG